MGMVLNSYYSVQKCDFYPTQDCTVQKHDNVLDFNYIHEPHTILGFSIVSEY